LYKFLFTVLLKKKGQDRYPAPVFKIQYPMKNQDKDNSWIFPGITRFTILVT